MAEDHKNLPSIDDFSEKNDNLPSIEEFLSEEDLPSAEEVLAPKELPTVKEILSHEDLPSVEDFIENPDESDEIEAEKIEEVVEEVESTIDLTEIVRLINEVREDIPEIPEIKSYDAELEKICEIIDELREEIPTVKDYDPTVEAICEQIDLVREEIKDLPEVKYYDEELQKIEDRFDLVHQEIINLPEPKYYEEDLLSIREDLENIHNTIIPDLSWVNEDFQKVQDSIATLKDRIDFDFETFSEDIEKKSFETRVEFATKTGDLEKNFEENKKKIWDELSQFSTKIWEYHNQFKDDDRKLKKQIKGEYNQLKIDLEEKLNQYNIDNVKTDELLLKYFTELKEEVTDLPQIKYYDDDLGYVRKDIKELYKLVESIKNEQKELNEQTFEIVNDKSDSSNEVEVLDPLVPLDKQFPTFKSLADHYRLFINRIQIQIAAIGGGGAVRLDDLEDVAIPRSGVATDGYTIVWDLDNKVWIPAENGGSAGAAGTWAVSNVGIWTSKNVGIATTAREDIALYVEGDATVTGDLNVSGDVVYDEVSGRNLNVTGVATLAVLHVGAGTTWPEDLVVNGNARILGILTIGTESVTIGSSSISIGNENVTISDSSVTIGDNVTIQAGASGINSAPNVYFVAKDGDDDNNGTSIDNAKLTISAAVGIATSGATVKVLSGTYVEDNPIDVGANISIVGDDQRSVYVSGNYPHKDIFAVRKGVKLANMTFQNHVSPAAAVGFPTSEIAENVGGGKWKGPYIQNCTSDTTTGVGIRIDGNQARSLKAMNVDAFTQYNQGGIGVAVTNGGFAQLVSLFTICCDQAVTAHKGGQADIANSNCSFGTYGLVADGVSPLQYTGIVTSVGTVSQDNVTVNVGITTYSITGVAYTNTTGEATITTSAAHDFQVGMGVTLSSIVFTCSYGSKTYPYQTPYIFRVASVPSTTTFTCNLGISTVSHTYSSGGTAKIDVDRPYDGQQVYFDQLYQQINTIAVGSGGTGYTSTPTVTVASPSGPNGETATAYATVENEIVTSISIISNGSQYTETPAITIGSPNVGVNTATATASMSPLYYTINSSTPVVSGITTLTLETNLLNTVGVGSTAFFHQSSRIVASSHTFEYVGSGNTITQATPKRGGVTIQANEVYTTNGGKVVYTSTDQSGNFRIGDDLQINQVSGTISGRSFSKSLFSEMTPFILALS